MQEFAQNWQQSGESLALEAGLALDRERIPGRARVQSQVGLGTPDVSGQDAHHLKNS
jgi:hypothetical protein